MTIETGATQSQTDASTSFLRAARAGQLDKILTLLSQDVDINVSNANGLNAMHLASKDGHSEVVNTLLERGAHIDAATKKGNTALHIAALAGQESVVRILVQHGAQVNIQSQNGFTPLYMAAQENHDSVVKFLLSNGANQSLATEDGFTPLAVAMQQGHEKVVAVLLEADTGRVRLPALHIAAKKDDCKAAALLLENDHNPDVTSKSGFTPLHIAAHYGNEAVARLLLTKGADVNCSAKHNICPLHVAAKWGKANMVALLAENGAQVEARTRDGLTPLHCAARSGHEHVVDMLLERGAPISGKSKNGLAPLHMAAQGDHSDAARILLYHRAPVDDLTVDYLTALHVAAHCGHVKVAKLLLDRNADANARALNGFTPLHIACKKNRIKVVELLLKYGASISATTESGLTPLHVAAFMGCMNIVIYLLQHEASPDVPTVRGETPLHLAARANQTDIIRILLRNGAAVDARAREMQTALHIASRLGNVDIVLLLVQHGAQLDALTADNYNALHIAAKQHNHEVAAVLLEHGAPPNAVTKKGFTPLHLAAKYGNLKVANLLMSQKDAELDPKGKNGVTPLHVAAQYKHHAVASALLEKGADPKAAAKNGHTPLHIAARKNQMETAAALMERGAAVDAESRAGCTPLHLASHQGHAEMCSLLIEQGADSGRKAKSGLSPLHLAAQEDHVSVAKILVNNGAKVDVCTKGGYTPLHVASHFGQTNMVKFLLESGADVQSTTCHGYTALHHAAQQGHINIVNLLLEHKADANCTTKNGQTPLDIAQKLGYVTVMDTLKGVSEPGSVAQAKDDKYRPVAPETMYETFMSDSEEEGGEDTMLTDQPYRYLTVDDMKSLGDDSLPIDVTRDERMDTSLVGKHIMEASQESTTSGPLYATDEIITAKTVNHIYNAERMKEGYCYNVENTQPKRKLQWKNFLVSFLVDARGGALRGCRGSGVRVIVPPLSAQQPTRITCRYVRSQRVSHMPPLMEGEALASRVLELGPVSAKFIGPIILEVPHFASLRGKEREIVILRSDNGTTWREHAVEAADCTIQDILTDTLDIDDLPEEPNGTNGAPARVTRILTHDFPQYFAVISRIRQEVHAIGPEGGMVSSSVVPQVQAVFPQGALTKKIKVGLQAQTIEADLTAKLLGRGVAVSPVVTVEPRRRKFHKAITLSMPAPRPHSQGMINQYTTSAPTLRLLCSISGGTNRAHWEDVTDSTPLTFVNDCVSFTTTVSARYWLMDCRNVSEATKMATELYREAIHVPFMARFVVYAKRTEQLQAKLRVFCVTDDKEDKTLERMERFSQVAKSKDVEVHEGKPVYLEFGGNFTPVAKSGDQPKLEFRALRENRLQLEAMVRGAHADAVARCQFMREARRPKGEPPQTPICVLNIVLPEEVLATDSNVQVYQIKETIQQDMTHVLTEESDRYIEKLTDDKISSMCNLLGMDWVPLAYELGITSAAVTNIREKGLNGAQQASMMIELWRSQGEQKAHDNSLKLALCRIGREDVLIPQSVAEAERRIQRNIYQERQSSEEIVGFKSPDSELVDREKSILEQEDLNKVFDKNDTERIQREMLARKDIAMDDSIGDREEAKYSPEEKSYVEDGSDREPSLSISEESEEEEGVKKSVAERKIQITRKLSSEKVPASKQKRELKEEIYKIKKQINPEVKKFHEQQTAAMQQESKDTMGKLSKRSSEDEDAFNKKSKTPSPVVEQVELPKVLPKAGPRHLQKHVRNESMIRFSSGDFSDVKVPQKKVDEKMKEIPDESVSAEFAMKSKSEVRKETITQVQDKTRTVTSSEEIITIRERDVAEAPLKEKISSFESKMFSEQNKSETDKSDNKIKLTEEVLKKHSEMQKTATEYTEAFIKDQIRAHEDMKKEASKDDVFKKCELKSKHSRDSESPELESDFASELMKVEETFQASAEYVTDKYKETYFKSDQAISKSFAKAERTDSTIVQFSSEEDSEFLKKSTDSETETESQMVTVKQKVGQLEEKLDKTKKDFPLKISIQKVISEEGSDDVSSKGKIGKQDDVAKLKIDSQDDSFQISSDEDAQVQRTDDESDSQIKGQSFDEVKVKVTESKQLTAEIKPDTVHARSDSMGSDFSKQSISVESKSPKHVSQESPLPYSQSTMDKTDSLADSVHSTERDVSYISQSESKVYSKDTRPTRSDSLDEASQFSDMEETQIGAHYLPGSDSPRKSKLTPAAVKVDTMRFLEQEYAFSSSELQGTHRKTDKPSSDEPAISAKARQFIETVPEDDLSVQECFFSKRIYSDSLEESEQCVTDNDSRRASEADSLKSDRSDVSGRDAQFKMCKISSEIEEGTDESLHEIEKQDELIAKFAKLKSDSKEQASSSEVFDAPEDSIFKKVTVKKHARSESISVKKLSSLDLKDEEISKMICVPPEIPQRPPQEFQMFVTEATDDFHDERISSFDREELSEKISSESSREIEVSDKKWSEGGGISSEDAVTDKVSSDSGRFDADSALKASSDTLLGGDARSPDLVESSYEEELHKTSKLTKDSPTLHKVEKIFSGMKDMAEVTAQKTEEPSKSTITIARESIGSAGELSLGKRISDAHSLTESKDYTFEESEDSLAHTKEAKNEMESKAKAILEPIYDKAIRSIRGDSLDDVEPFCMDQEAAPSRLPGIQEVKQSTEKASVSTSEVKVATLTEKKEAKLSLPKDLSKEGDKDYSVHSSPDEVEEKICTDTESELDQAKVLEIIEPTSEADGFVPAFDTSKLKQDSLDDADDLFAEKEGIFEDMEEFARQQFSADATKLGLDASTTSTHTSTTSTHHTITMQEMVKTEHKVIERLKLEGDADSLHSEISLESAHEGQISKSLSEIGAAAAASIGIGLKLEEHERKHDHDLEATELVKDASVTLASTAGIDLKHSFDEPAEGRPGRKMSASELVKDASVSIASTAGVALKPEIHEVTKSKETTEIKRHSVTEHHITELLSDASATLAASVGVEIKPDELEKIKSHHAKREHSITELLSDASATLAASVGVEIKSDEIDARKIHHPIVELLSDASATLAASVGVEIKPDDIENIRSQHTEHEHPITELLSDASATLAASVGVEIKPDEIEKFKSHHVERKPSITELISDASATLAASIGVEIKQEEGEKIKSHHTERKHSVTELISDASSTLAATVGVDIKPDEIDAKKVHHIERKHSVTELISDASSTLAATAGVEIKPDEMERIHSHHTERKPSITELISDASSTLAASVGVEIKPEEIDPSKSHHHITELLSDASATLAATLGVAIKPDETTTMTTTSETNRLHHITELMTDASCTLAASVGLELKPEVVKEMIQQEETKHEHVITELLSDSSSTLAAAVGIDVKSADVKVPESPHEMADTDKIVSEMKDLNRSDRRCSDLLEGISQPRIDTSQVTHGLSLKFSSTPPPSPVDLIHRATAEQQKKGSETSSDQHSVNLSPRDARIVKDEGDRPQSGFLPDTKVINRSSSPKSPIRHHDDNIAFVNVEALTMHPTEEKTEIKSPKSKIPLPTKSFIQDTLTTVISKKESTVQKLSGKEVFSEKQLVSLSGDEPITKTIETTRKISGAEYELKETETFEKIGDRSSSERKSVERDEKASAERKDSERHQLKKVDDDTAIIVTQKEFSEQGLYSGRQSKSEEKMTAIKDDAVKKTEVSYSERDLSHEQWGKEYFAERSELEPTDEEDVEFSQERDVYMESSSKVAEKDEKITSEEIIHDGKVSSVVTDFSKEESIVESKEHDDMSSDISQDTSLRSDLVEKRDSIDKSEMSPKSRSKSLKKEEVYEVDFIKELKVSSSQKSKGSSHDISQETHSEGDSDLIGQFSIPEDHKGKSPQKKESPVRKSEEHILEHVWEVSLQQQECVDETAGDLFHKEEPRSLELDFMSQSEPKSFTSGSDLGITTLASDLDLRTTQSGMSVTSSDDTYLVEHPSDASCKDSMIKSRESVETEYMIQSLDSQDAETLHKSMDSVSAETMQHSERDESSMGGESMDFHKKLDHKLLKEKSLEDICSSGYDTDLSSAEFLISKLEHERGEADILKSQPLADLEKTIDEVKQSLEAAHGEIINEKSDGSIKYKQSPSEFEFKLISPDRPEVIHEESVQQLEYAHSFEKESAQEQKTSASSVPSEEVHEVKSAYVSDDTDTSKITKVDESSETKSSTKESDSSSKQDDTYLTSDDEKDTARERGRQSTQQELSDTSTGLESGPTSLLDTETEMGSSDKEDSPKSSVEGVRLRPIQRHLKAGIQAGDRRSVSDVEGYSSSGESHYQSFEHTESPHSRPLSSDVEGLLTGHSTTADFQSALMTQEYSSKSQKTSKEYVTAGSTLSSRGSVKSLDSESSGHVASIDISDASETLVPSAAELKDEMTDSSTFETGLRDSIIIEENIEKIPTTSSPEITRTADSNESEEGSLDDEIIAGEVVSKMKRSHEMSFQPKELLPEKFPSESISESTDLEIDTGIPESDSQVFSMSKIETRPSSVRHIQESTEVSTKSSSKSVEPSKSYEISEKIIEYRTSSVVYKTPEKKTKPVEETVIGKTIVSTTKIEPRTIKYSSPKRHEVDFEAIEACIIPKGSAEYEEIVSTQVISSQSGTVISSTSERKISEPYPIDSKQSSSSSLKIQDDYLSTPQTPSSNPSQSQSQSQSSESTDNGREYVLDDMYEPSEDQYPSERALTDSKSEMSVTTEDRTVCDTQRAPDSPSSEEFEMVDKPNEMDDFVVIEEVAREASEFDTEGKSLSISKIPLVKQHDEEVEQFLSQTAKKTSDTEYSTSGSLSEEELANYELEQKRLRAQENAEIEAGKKWIQMQFEGDLAAARYEYERGPLEDIKEEEMTDFDASRIGSFTSQKESVGSYGSIKNSFGSMSESDMLRRRYMMRSSDQDDVSVSSLQEFENLEQILSMEAYQHSSSSQDSLNGSLPKRYHRNKAAQGDDVSISSLKEFEGLESACLEALKIEIQAKQKEALLLSQDGRLSSASFLDMEKRSYSQGSSESSPPQKSGSSPGQKSGSPSQKSGSPGQKSGSPGQKSGSPSQRFGSPSQKTITDALAMKKLIEQQIEGDKKPPSDKVEGEAATTVVGVTDEGTPITVVTAQKKVYDKRGAFYVPDVTGDQCEETMCVQKKCYDCTTEGPEMKIAEQRIEGTEGTSGSEGRFITTTQVVQQRFVDGKKISEVVTTMTSGDDKGMDIPGAASKEQYSSGEFYGSGHSSMCEYGSEFSSSITSQQSDTESLITMMEKQPGMLGSTESITTTTSRKMTVSPRQQLDLDLVSRAPDQLDRESSPMSARSGSGVFSSGTSKHFTDPASGSWSGLDEDMSSSGSFSRAGENEVTLTSTSRAREDLMLGSTDSLEQTSSNATRATYNYEVDTPMTGSLTSGGSNTMVSSLDTLDPVTAIFEKGEKALRVSTEDCFAMETSKDYEQESDGDRSRQPQVRERTIMYEGRQPSEESTASGRVGSGGATFFIGDTPITKQGGEKQPSAAGISDIPPPVPAQRRSISGIPKPIVLEKKKPKDDDSEDEENE